MYCVYAIGSKESLLNLKYEECYIGVTKDPKNRWIRHSKSSYLIGRSIRKNCWNIEDNFVVIFKGSSTECFEKESEYRPLPFMGLNEASGGRGGHTKYSSERNKKISNALKGVRKTYGEKISATKKQNGSSRGEKNSNAKKWILISPNEEKFILNGELFSFCKQNFLSANTLRLYLGEKVPPICTKYRGKGIIKDIRNNTTGWLLIKES